MRRLSIIALLAAAPAFWGCSKSEPAVMQSARLEEVDGMVRVSRNGETATAEVDMEIFSGDEVVTLQDGEVTISMLDDHLVRLSPNSRFVLDELKPRSVSGALWARATLLAGQAVASLGKLSGGEADFAIATSSAVCAVKGTTFGVEVADGETTVSVAEGEVEMAPLDEKGQAGEGIRVKPGYESSCRARMRERLQARRMSGERRRLVEKRLEPVREHARRFRKMRRSGELHDLRRLRALSRAGKLDEASGPLKKRMQRNPGLREKIIKHGERHQQLQQDRRQQRQRVDRTKSGGKAPARRVTRPAQKKQAVRKTQAPARQSQSVKRVQPGAGQKKQPAKPAVPQQKKAPAPAPQRK